MSAVTEAKEKVKEIGSQGGGKDSIAKKVVVPLVASAASAAAAYAVRKLPGLVQDKVIPKLKDARSSESASNAVAKAKDAVGGAVSTVTERVVGNGESSRSALPSLSSKQLDQLERARRGRAKRRAERRKALKG